MMSDAAGMSDNAGMTGVVELQELLLATDTLQEFLGEVASRAAAEVSAGLLCGLTVRSDGRPLTIASSDGYANMLDQLQYRLDHGPCLTTLRTGQVVLDDGTDDGNRWPLYRMQGEAAGLGTSLSVPVTHGQQVLAALNLDSRARRSFAAVERDRAQGFADRAAGGVAIALRLARRAELSDDLQAALAGRAVIDQALGIVMGQRRCSADEAFGVLRDVSQTSNIKLREVATRLIAATSGQPPRPEPPLQQRPATCGVPKLG
jgi:transcriptional regulator with GAF, ATPase, and Fis domain